MIRNCTTELPCEKEPGGPQDVPMGPLGTLATSSEPLESGLPSSSASCLLTDSACSVARAEMYVDSPVRTRSPVNSRNLVLSSKRRSRSSCWASLLSSLLVSITVTAASRPTSRSPAPARARPAIRTAMWLPMRITAV